LSGRRSGFGSITRLPSKRYRARYTVPGTDPQVWVTAPQTFARKDQAELWLARQRAAIEDGLVRPSSAASKVTVREYAENWLASRRSASGDPLRPSTRRVYEHYLNHHVYPALGDVRLPQLTPDALSGWYSRLLPDRPTLRARTYALLRTILTGAVEDGLLAQNPCRIRGAGRARPATPKTLATPAQVAELAAAMPDRLALFILLGAWCQLRNGEVLELRRRDVTPERVSITRGVTWAGGKPHVGPPKTDAGVRSVSVPPHIAQAVTEHLDLHTSTGADALLFAAAPGGSVNMNPSTYAYFVKNAVRRTSLPPEFRFHWLRHTV
jgi:integrase